MFLLSNFQTSIPFSENNAVFFSSAADVVTITTLLSDKTFALSGVRNLESIITRSGSEPFTSRTVMKQ